MSTQRLKDQKSEETTFLIIDTQSVKNTDLVKEKSYDACEPLNSQIKRRTRVVGLFPNEDSLLRLVTAVLIEISETWETGKAYLKLTSQKPKTSEAKILTFRKKSSATFTEKNLRSRIFVSLRFLDH